MGGKIAGDGSTRVPKSEVLEPNAIKLWEAPEQLPKQTGTRWENGSVRLDARALKYTAVLSRDTVFRAEIRMNPDHSAAQIAVRFQPIPTAQPDILSAHFYAVEVRAGEGTAKLIVDHLGKKTYLQTWPLPRTYGSDEWMRLELRAVGDVLTVSADGKLLGTVHDASHPVAGGVQIYAGSAGYFRNISYVPLDKPPAAFSATKDTPFVNTLGMRFVPVPGTRVLFNIWDTRVRDFAAYARANKADDSWTRREKDGEPVSHEPDDPVVGVSWDDAQAFCRWLTRKENAEGALPKGARYRLPTDEEWSRAAGLPPEPGATPAEKCARNAKDFPWGGDFPPKATVGNYADSAFHGKFPKEAWIEGYTDGYATTSPVGSFPANAYGLYDMGGNVWQWCEDWYDALHRDRVLRGSSWHRGDRAVLLSSARHANPPDYRDSTHGFRCVLVRE